MGAKRCTKCGMVKRCPDEFSTRHRTGRGDDAHPWCKSCVNRASGNANLRRKTGATRDWKAIMWALQMGNCRACGNPVPLWGMDSHVDHFEDEGVPIPLAVLHSNCNTGIGKAYHSAEIARAWADYLDRTR